MKRFSLALAAIVVVSHCVPAFAAEPRDLDADLRARVAAWLKDATPPPDIEHETPAEREAFLDAFRKGAAGIVNGPPYDAWYRGDDPIKRARSRGAHAGAAAARDASFVAYKALIDEVNADPTLRVSRASELIVQATLRGENKNVELLLDRGADADAPVSYGYQFRPLHAAVMKETGLAELLLKHGASADAVDKHGQTPLFYHGGPEDAALLIKHGAKVNARNDKGETPLFTARDAETLSTLIKHGAKVDVTSNSGDTPLHRATDAEMVDLFVKHGLDVNAANNTGDTPLHVAARSRYLTRAIGAMIKHGGKTDAANHNGEKPIDQPVVQSVARYMKRFGAVPTEAWTRANYRWDMTIPWNFEENQLVHVIDFFRNVSGVNIYTDFSGLGVAPDTPITYRTKLTTAGTSLTPTGEALTAVLEQAGKGNGKLTWEIDPDGIVLIATPERLKSLMPANRDDEKDFAPAVRRKINEPLPVEFDDGALEHAVDFFHNVTDVPIRIDWPALSKVGVQRDTKVNLTLSRVPMRRALEITIHHVAGDKAVVRAKKGALFVSTPEGVEAFMKKGE